jgi:membrane fusion protein (multidrug efflux system)
MFFGSVNRLPFRGLVQTLCVGFLAGLLLLFSGCDGAATATANRPGAKPHLVETAIVNKSTIGVERIRTGTLRAPREVRVFTQEEGRITLLPFREGDVVQEGDIIATLDDQILRAQFARAQALHRKADQNLKRIQRLYREKLVSEQDLIQAQTDLDVANADELLLATRVGYTTIKASITGVISERLTEPGNIAEQHTHLLTISDLTALITEVTLSDMLLPTLAVNDVVQVRIDALGDQTFPGHITRVYPNVDPVTRRGTIEIELKPVPEGARPGQLSRAYLKALASERMLIPFSAMRSDLDGVYVYNVDDENRVGRSPIITGVRIGEQVEVLSGLVEGQRVVTKGFLGLETGKTVEVVPTSTQHVTASSQ